MKVTSKGQVTIPVSLRRRLGIEPGHQVDFSIDGDAARLVRRPDSTGAALVESMRSTRSAMSTEVIMALTRGDA